MIASYAGILQQAQRYQAQKKWYRALSQRAAVCMVVDERPGLGPAVLMIKRAERTGDPWSGQMAFPGGKHDTDDEHITATALREFEEELGTTAASLQRFGRLSDILARPYRPMQKPMVVSPLLFSSSAEITPEPNEEVADVLWVPLSLFADVQARQEMQWQRNGVPLRLPCYFYEGKRIWGMSLMMLDELMRLINCPE